MLRVGFDFFFHFKSDVCAILGFHASNVEFIDRRRCNGNIGLNCITGRAYQARYLRVDISR